MNKEIITITRGAEQIDSPSSNPVFIYYVLFPHNEGHKYTIKTTEDFIRITAGVYKEAGYRVNRDY